MEDNVFSDDEIKKFVTHFCDGELNQFAYVIIDKAFELHSDEEKNYFREQCLASIEGTISKFKLPKEATEAEKSQAAAILGSLLLVKINDMIGAGKFVMPQNEK